MSVAGDRLAVQLLGRHVAERADDRRAALVARRIEHAAEVDERARAVRGAHDVRRLDVAVDDRRRARVEVVEDLEAAHEHVAQLGLATAGGA